jgi:hypothetical protein
MLLIADRTKIDQNLSQSKSERSLRLDVSTWTVLVRVVEGERERADALVASEDGMVVGGS